MRTTDVYDIKRSGDLGGDKVAMKIDSNSIAHLMSVLTDLYSDPEMAVIREYSTNARDSHVEAGVTRPIEISLPNGMNPYFKIRDYGVGMSVDDINQVYSQYGASTKRDTDTQTGMLGLGCKSALTYTSQFTITSVKNGVKAVVVVSRIEDGTGVMEIVDTAATNDHNGVEISIPVKSSHQFVTKTAQFFQYWDEGSVLVNGQKPARITLDMVTPEIGIASRTAGLSNDMVVMGGVAYPCSRKLYHGNRPHNDQFNVVAFVEIGDVNFTPSREDLSYTKRTEAKVAEITKIFTDNLVKTATDEITQQPTHPEAFAKFLHWQTRLGATIVKDIKYKGVEFPDSFSFKHTQYNPNYNRYQVQQRLNNTRISHEALTKYLLIDGYDGVALTSRYKEKIKHWITQENLSYNTTVILTDTRECDPWISEARRATWTEIKDVVLPGNTSPRQKSVPTYLAYDAVNKAYVSATAIDKTKRQVYISPTAQVGLSQAIKITDMFPDIQIVVLAENRWAKFKRENTGAIHLRDYLKNEWKIAESLLTQRDKMVLGMSAWEKQRIQSLPVNEINDPVLVDAINTINGTGTTPSIDKYNNAVLAYRFSGGYADGLADVKVLSDYPLLSNMDRGTIKHAVIYINAIYSAKQAGLI